MSRWFLLVGFLFRGDMLDWIDKKDSTKEHLRCQDAYVLLLLVWNHASCMCDCKNLLLLLDGRHWEAVRTSSADWLKPAFARQCVGPISLGIAPRACTILKTLLLLLYDSEDKLLFLHCENSVDLSVNSASSTTSVLYCKMY